MHVAHVHIHVKPECVQAFIEATLDNARNSVQEPGIARFDFFQHADDLTRFILNEVYLTPEAPAAHKASAHYLRWRDAVVDMMAEPRSNVPLVNLFPADKDF
jgi:quinol monooxygenase YgiN